MSEDRPPSGPVRVEDVDLAGARVHGLDLEGAQVTDAHLAFADISGDFEGLRINGVDVGPFIEAELDRRFPERVALRASDVAGLRTAWTMLETRWAGTTERAARLPDTLQRTRVEEEWSFVETLRHLIFATDCWLSRAIRLETSAYHPWGLPWSGPGPEWCRSLGLDVDATPGLAEIRPIRLEHQRSVRDALAGLTDDVLGEVRTAPDDPGHPHGDHTVLACLHVLLNEEWEHHRYAERDLAVLEGRSGAGPTAGPP